MSLSFLAFALRCHRKQLQTSPVAAGNSMWAYQCHYLYNATYHTQFLQPKLGCHWLLVRNEGLKKHWHNRQWTLSQKHYMLQMVKCILCFLFILRSNWTIPRRHQEGKDISATSGSCQLSDSVVISVTTVSRWHRQSQCQLCVLIQFTTNRITVRWVKEHRITVSSLSS